MWLAISTVALTAYSMTIFDRSQLANNSTDRAGEFQQVVWLVTCIWVIGAIAFGWLTALAQWDRRFRMATAWNTWFLLAAGILAVTSLLGGPSFLASVGMFCLIASVTCSHFRKTSKSGTGTTFSDYTIVGLGFLVLPLNVANVSTALLEYVLGRSSSFVLSLVGVPFQYSGTAFLTEAGEIQIGAVQLPFTFQAVFIFTTFWIARHRRSWLALPMYGVAALLWSLAVAQAQLAYLVCFADGASSNFGLGVLSLVGLSVAAVLVVSTDRLLRIALFEIPADSVSRKNNPIIHAWNRTFEAMTVGSEAAPSGH